MKPFYAENSSMYLHLKSLHNDEPTELENLLDMIIALEESGEAELQETQGTASKKLQY